MTRNWREVVNDPEPLCIKVADVVEFLERRGRPGMASLVRHMGRRDADGFLAAEELRRENAALRAALEKYEPTVKHEPTRYTPPPEASD